MYDYVRGPLVWVAMLVFVIGTVYQVVRFFMLSREVTRLYHVPSLQKKYGVNQKSFIKRIIAFFKKAKYTVLAVHPTTIAVSTLFHASLVIVPLFLLGHNELIELAIGVSLPSLSEKASDILTVIVLLCCAFFLIRRIALTRVRALSGLSDFLVLALAILPFLSGFLAFHQVFDYRTMMIVHMLSGELMLMVIPFTKLIHMIFFFLNRFLVINEHTLGRGSRVW